MLGAFLRRGVDILGGVRITAPDDFLDVLTEGGSGYHFFGRSAERVVLQRRVRANLSSNLIGCPHDNGEQVAQPGEARGLQR